MTGVMQALAAASSTIVNSWIGWVVNRAETLGASVYAQLVMTATGLCNLNCSATSSGGEVQGSQQWSYSIGPGIGASYWIRATLVAGTAPDTGTMNTWQQLNVDRTYGWAPFTTPATKQCTLKFEFATDAAGTNIVLTAAGNQLKCVHT